MVKEILIYVNEKNQQQKINMLIKKLNSIHRYNKGTIINDIFPEMVKNMRMIISNFETTFSPSWYADNQRFQIKSDNTSQTLSVVAKRGQFNYAQSLIHGTKYHGPVFIGDWAERNSILSLKKK